MTLIKSLLLGSAAGIVAVASAQAADLPTKKAAPAAEYVRICSIGGITGFVLPGSDTCLKISGLVTAQYTLGTTADRYAITGPRTLALVSAKKYQDSLGMYVRGRMVMDAVSNTAYGPLVGHVEIQSNYGNGFDSLARDTEINNAYLTWAGLTAGKHASFYDFLGGSINTWDDIVTPDHTGGPIPLLAYTASFGGGFSATISFEQNEPVPFASFASTGPAPNTAYLGVRAPDIVAQLKATQAWGTAQISGVAHQVRVEDAGGFDKKTWGYGILGGVSFNIPGMPGSDVKLQGVYARDAMGYTGLLSPGSFNYKGMTFADAPLYDVVSYGGGNWGNTKAWSVAGGADFALGPTFKISPELSYGSVKLTNNPAGSFWSTKWDEFVGGGTLEWVPVHNLVFDLDLLYASGKQDTPNGYVGVGANAWKSSFSGFNAKLRIERDF